MIQKHLTAKNTDKYIDVLQKLLDEYNHRTHSTIKMSPFEASKPENRDLVLDAIKGKLPEFQPPKFKVNDRVRIYKYKKLFEKGYKTNWTKEIFVIDQIQNTNPITYKIKDLESEPILGSFYEQELQKTKF